MVEVANAFPCMYHVSRGRHGEMSTRRCRCNLDRRNEGRKRMVQIIEQTCKVQ